MPRGERHSALRRGDVLSRRPPSDVAHSVRDRLKGIARQSGEPFAEVLVRYGLERLLYRLSRSEWRTRFTLKGALLFALWSKHPHRATRDADLAGPGRFDEAEIGRVFRSLCVLPVEPDGVVFAPEAVQTETIRRGNEYHGVRVRLTATLKRTRIPLQVDIGLGDVVEPRPAEAFLPVLLPEMPSPRLRTYTPHSVVAEKLHAIVELGFDASRVKDYFDLFKLAELFQFDGETLAHSIARTFERRKTTAPVEVPAGLGDEFAHDRMKLAMWHAFVRRSRLVDGAPEMADALPALRGFLLPPLAAARDGTHFGRRWMPGKGWRTRG